MRMNEARPNETREMRLIGKLISLSPEHADASLPEFIARRRAPGAGWRTWDQISFELTDVIGEIVTDGTLRQWANRYGIPEYTKADGTGKVSTKEYAAALRKADIAVS